MTVAQILGPIGMKAIEGRGLDPEIAVKMGLYTGRSENGEVVPDIGGNIVVFPFIDHGVVVNEKYRAAGKRFWQKAGGKKTFYNADIMDDPALEAGSAALIITEGEPDALAALSCGFPFTVSVPDGAPPAVEPSSPTATADATNDETGKFQFLWNNRDRLKRIKRFIIAVDNDAPGQRLAAELVRRLMASRCYFVTYPDGCKDLNDVLMQHGEAGVTAVLNAAQPYPVKGVYTLADYPDAPQIATYGTGWPMVDTLFQMFAPSFTVISGLPGSGKSTWLTNLLINMAEMHGWKSAVFSPEMPIVPHLRDKMRRIAGRSPVDQMGKDRLANVDRWIGDNFVFIDHDTQSDDEDITLEWILERAADAVLRHGVRVLVIDPWNEVEHAKDSRETTTDYINRALRSLKKFGNRYGLAVFVVAHPTKDVAKDGKSRVPTLYDIEGCYSDDTEVLTKRGWLHHGQVTMSDDVACFNPATSSVEYHQPSRIIRKEHDGEMYHFEGAGYDMLVTPEHRMVVKPKWEEPVGDGSRRGRPVRFEKDKWHLVEASSLPSANFTIPLGGNPIAGAEVSSIVIGEREYPADAFLRLVGWYIAEGGYSDTGLTWAQAEGELADRFTAAFAEAGIPASVYWCKPTNPKFMTMGKWYIGNRFCADLVKWFNLNCGRGEGNKRIPEAVFDLCLRQKMIVLDAYLEGDGCEKDLSRTCVTTSSRLRDDLQRLAVELGIATNGQRRDPGKPNQNIQHIVSFGGEHRREVTMRTQRNLTRESYRGLVWCLTVPTGAYFVRRNCRVMVSGNSAAWFNKPDIGIIIDRPDAHSDETMVYVKKVRFEGTGEKGAVKMRFDRETSRYELLNAADAPDLLEAM